MTVLKYIWSELSQSENQSDWFDYAESHLAHMMLGILSVNVISVAFLCVFGEFPDKWIMAAFVGLWWGVYELGTQGLGDVWGNFEDWLFLYAYSALPCVLLFTEIPETTMLRVNMEYIGPICAIVAAHLLAGIATRIYRAVR